MGLYKLQGESNLWAAVLLQAIKDATNNKGVTYLDHEHAKRWLGPFPSKDFRFICNMIGIDPDAAHERIKYKLNLVRDECIDPET